MHSLVFPPHKHWHKWNYTWYAIRKYLGKYRHDITDDKSKYFTTENVRDSQVSGTGHHVSHTCIAFTDEIVPDIFWVNALKTEAADGSEKNSAADHPTVFSSHVSSMWNFTFTTSPPAACLCTSEFTLYLHADVALFPPKTLQVRNICGRGCNSDGYRNTRV